MSIMSGFSGIRLQDISMKHTHWNEKVVEPCTYVFDGDHVLVPYGKGTAALKVVVACAAGHHARVMGKNYDRWVNITDLARMQAAKVIFDESAYGKIMKDEWRWSFCLAKDMSHITVTDSKEPILVAVTKSQYKGWSNQKILAKKRSFLQLWWAKLRRLLR